MILAAKTILNGDGSSVFNEYGLLVLDGKIQRIAPLDVLMSSHPAERLIDYGEATILPGLIDMHMHIGFWWRQHDTGLMQDYEIALIGLKQARDAFSAGVTTIRDVTCPNHLTQTLIDYSAKGYYKLPRVFHSNMGLCITGGHGSYFYGGTVEVNGKDAIIEAVRAQKKAGATWIKLMMNHGSDRICEFTMEELVAAVDTAHMLGMRVVVHSATQPSLQAAIDVGVDTIEHGNYLTVEQALVMKENGIAWCPTIYSHEKFLHVPVMVELKEAQEERFLALMQTGVTIITGTDMVKEIDPPAPVAQEIEALVKNGMPVLKAIQAGTHNGASVLGIGDSVGLLCNGFIADILVVQGNPVVDVTALQHVLEVYQSGISVYRS